MIVADDFGLGPLHDKVMCDLVQKGVVDAVSVLVDFCSPKSAEAICGTGAKTGLHFNMTLPLAHETLPNRNRLLASCCIGLYRDQARFRLKSQLEKFHCLFGRPPDFIDGHEHCHQFPGIQNDVLSAAKSNDVPVRSTVPLDKPRGVKGVVLAQLGQRMKRAAERFSVQTNDGFFGVMPLHQTPDPELFQKELEAYRRAGGRSWMMVHPGSAKDALQTHRSDWREMEAKVLAGAPE